MSSTNKILSVLIGAILFVATIGIIFNMTTDAVNYESNTTTYIYGVVPANVSLNDCVSLTSITNGSDILPVSNYTDLCSSDLLTIKENVSWLPATTYIITYEYTDGTTLTGATAILTVLIGLLVIVGFVISITKRSNK